MTRLTNSFNAGTDGATVTTGGSGLSGDAFDEVTIGAGSTLTYNAANMYFGPRSIAIDPANNEAAYVAYHDTVLGSLTEVYGRLYVKYSSLPVVVTPLVDMRAAGSLCGRISIQTDGKVRTADRNLVTIATSTNVLTAGVWARIEWHFIGSASVGDVEVRLFLSPHAVVGSPTETVGGAFASDTQGAAARYRTGAPAGVSGNTPVFYLDEVAWDTVGWIGPHAAQVSPGFIDASPTFFTHKANRNMTIGALIDLSPTIYTPVQIPLKVTSAGAFQASAFQGV